VHLEIDGLPVSAEVAWQTAAGSGHFTAMQVRAGATRGLPLHLIRLATAHRELFGAELDGDRVRSLIRHALDGTADASVRVYGYERDPEPALLVTVREPADVASPLRLRSTTYQRPAAHLKHLQTEQGYRSRVARKEGYDDALLTTQDGTISESATANIGFLDGAGVVWPEAPQLAGITMQLLDGILPGRGIPAVRRPVRLGDVPTFESAFLTSARGVATVAAIDEVDLPERPDRIADLRAAYDAVAWDPI
jgi:branched-subunit amino acid aminotransferase/4-amino-4-deoxychorismate lyase